MPNLCSYDKEGRKRQVGNWESQDFRWTGCSLWLRPDFCLQAQQQISEYHNCKKDEREASGASLPCEEGEGGAVRASRGQMAGKLAYHDLERPPLRFLLNFNFHEGSVN